MMWRTRSFYQDIIFGRMEIEPRFTKNLPEWPAFDRFANGAFSRLLWVGLYIAFFVFFATSPWLYLLLPIVIAMGAFHGAVINWFAHKYGYINFKLTNTSMNLFFIDILMLGESYHNNHHKHPSSINFGSRWHEIDPLYPVIRFLGWIGIIRLPKLATIKASVTNDDNATG
jgi:stearoyl-CoA desaturase (delta-9 desaturase)